MPFLFNLLTFILASLLGAAVAFAQPACDPGFTDDGDSIAAATDVDDDNDGLIEICGLVGLDSIRNKLDGTAYKESSSATENTTGCPTAGCTGYELTVDLDFAGGKWGSGGSVAMGWPPIGGDTGFGGEFEGNGHVIKNLYINNIMVSAPGQNKGLFSVIAVDGKVRNLGLTGADMSVTGGSFVGGLAGINRGDVNNCHSTGSVEAAAAAAALRSYTGGLVGENYGDVVNSYATGTVTVSAPVAGGLVGGMSDGTLSNCYATGSVAEGSGTVGELGGLVGTSSGPISNCYATGSVGGTGNDRGALVGRMHGSSPMTSNCYATGSVTTGGTDTGGLVGESSGTVSNSYWENAGTAIADAMDATDKTAEQLKSLPIDGTTDLYDAWSTDDWDFGDATQYPALKSLRKDDTDMQLEGYLLCDQPGQDEDSPLRAPCGVSIAVVDPAEFSEGSVDNLFEITRKGAPGDVLTVRVSASDGGAGFLPLDPVALSVVIPEGESKKSFTVVTEDDDVDEADGTLTATLSEDAAYDVVAPSSAELTLTDNDLPEISIIAGASSVTEGPSAAAAFTVSRPAWDVTADLVVSLTVDGGTADFLATSENLSPTVTITAEEISVDFEVGIVDDEVDEADGTLTVTVSPMPSVYTLSGSASAMVEVADNDPILVFITGSATAEGMGAVFTLMRARAEAGALAVKVTVDDGAGDFLTDPLTVTEGTETTELPLVSGSVTVTIAADQGSQTFTVSTVDDTTDEADGTLTATIIAEVDGPYRVHATDAAILMASVEVDVTDDDLPSITSFKIGENFGVIDENAVPNKTITVTVAEAERTLLVDVTPTVVAVRSDATVTPPGMVTFEDGTAQDYTVTAGGDTVTYQVTVNVVVGTPPGVPGGFSVVAGVEQVTLSWMAPTELGSTGTVSRYEYRQTQGTEVSPWEAVDPSTALTQVVGSLMADVVYGFEVRAVGSNELAGERHGEGRGHASRCGIPDVRGKQLRTRLTRRTRRSRLWSCRKRRAGRFTLTYSLATCA